MNKIAVLLLTIFLLPVSLGAADFGLILEHNTELGGIGSGEPFIETKTSLIPRLSFLLGDSGDLYLSAGVTLAYEEEVYVFPELLRTEFSWRFGGAEIRAGRMQYAAPFAHVAEGLFDGLQFLYDSPAGTFNIGAWYTGLLYKKKNNITVTAEDKQSYYAAVDYDNFVDTYFASRRMVAAMGWEHPSLAESFGVNFALVAQVDLNGRDEYLHSQYLTAKIGIPAGRFAFELGGALEFAETSQSAGFNIGLAGQLGVFWTLPGAFLSRLSFTGFFSSGREEDESQNGSLAAFSPLSSKSYGDILEAAPSGISMLCLDYTARLHKTLSAGVTSSYFIRSDLGTYRGYPLDDIENNDGYFLGNEFFARLVWSPVSDLQFNLGGGIFLPVMGNAAPGREPQWRVKLAAVLALY